GGAPQPGQGISMVFLLVLVFFIMGLVGFLICHVLKKKGYRCRTFRDEPDLDNKDGNEDTMEKIVSYIIQNEASVLTAAARTGPHPITTRCTWAPRRRPASTAARRRGARCSARGAPRRAGAGCIPERPPSSQWAGTAVSFARHLPAGTSPLGSLQSPCSFRLPCSPHSCCFPLRCPSSSCSSRGARWFLHLEMPVVCGRL
uniref:RELT like 2 n=1 Tax=Malurus cyaneus samueli TaxID=2593467 RepID=A0A8C5U067_9PASS